MVNMGPVSLVVLWVLPIDEACATEHLHTWFTLNLQPKFLTKEERAAEAVKRRQEQVAAQRKAADEERKKQQEFLKAAKDFSGIYSYCL